MKTISLKSIRSEFKAINGKSINNVISGIYALMNEAKENGIECRELRAIMPKSAKEAKSYANEIREAYKIGSLKYSNLLNENGTIIGLRYYVVKPSADMILRFFLNRYNEAVPEAQYTKKDAKIKHECATRKAKECKDENKQTANTMK